LTPDGRFFRDKDRPFQLVLCLLAEKLQSVMHKGPGPRDRPDVSFFMILAKKQCLAAPGHVTGLTACEDNIAQKFGRIKTAESTPSRNNN